MKFKNKKTFSFRTNIVVFVAFMIISSISLCGCNENGNNLTEVEKKLLGTWFGGGIVNEVISFFPDHTCSYYLDLSGTWSVEDYNEGYQVIFDLQDKTDVYFIKFFENETVLGLFPDGSTQPLIFRKQ